MSQVRLNDAERLALIEPIRKGDNTALRKFLFYNRGLCVLAVRPYVGNCRMEQDELLSCAAVGIFVACFSWDLQKGAFTTHAINLIRWEIGKELQKRRLIHLPRTVSLALPRVGRYIGAYQQRTGGKLPDSDEIAADTGLPLDTVRECLQLREERFEHYDEAELNGDNDEPGPVCRAIATPSTIAIEETVLQNVDFKRAFWGLLDEQERGAIVWQLRGFTLAEHGRAAGHSREWARLVYSQAVAKLQRYFKPVAMPLNAQRVGKIPFDPPRVPPGHKTGLAAYRIS